MVAFLVAFLSLSGCSTQLKSDFPQNSTDQFDIVFVSIDTLRSDHLSCYGYEEKPLHSLTLWQKWCPV